MTKKSYTDLKPFGQEIGRLRERRGLTQLALLHKLNQELFDIGYTGKLRGEKWLHRLENGQLVNLPRVIFDALGRVLECRDEELARLHLLADRNIAFIISGVSTIFKQHFNYVMFDFLDEVCEIAESLAVDKPITKLPQKDVDELFYSAIEMVIKNRRSESK